ncbi:glycoside hydrolase family 99-like domain-containing protein [Clostridium perfringens]|nr:glycoside hydrolase family 99-like domain-containing protein [Clostridium perfringens]
MNRLKIVAFYLPQYHQILENDKWWGEGFTDWVNVKRAKKLYDDHNQPRIPLNNNYYDLLDEEIQLWQSMLAEKYGVYGFCYYHYWFTGKQLLEKPINNMIKNSSIKLPFCICWANEPWCRTWDGSNKEVLMEQNYGDKKDWKLHFDYLITLFKDERYIKVDNKPMFVVYRTESIEKRDEMFKYFENESIKHGFSGIHLVEMMTGFQNEPMCNLTEAIVEFEPNYTLRYDIGTKHRIKRKVKKILRNTFNISTKRFLDIYNYEEVWDKIVSRNRNYSDKKIYPGAFMGWDNSPRKGNNSIIFENDNPSLFKRYMKKQIEKAEHEYQSEYLFINAWNEWAEGTYLEPDTKNKYAYLNVINEIINK